jgi:hypothetical protein
VQLGYFQHFGDSTWLWGVKSSYIYQDKSLARENLVVPQSGTTSGPNVPTFPGFSVTRSYEVFLDHQITLVPFVGRSFKNGFVYAGAGPSLSRVGASLITLARMIITNSWPQHTGPMDVGSNS